MLKCAAHFRKTLKTDAARARLTLAVGHVTSETGVMINASRCADIPCRAVALQVLGKKFGNDLTTSLGQLLKASAVVIRQLIVVQAEQTQ